MAGMSESRRNMNTMRAKVIKIGNSYGIRIPKLLIKQIGVGSVLEIVVQHGNLLLKPISHPRDGWDEQFRQMAENEDDKLLDTP